MLMTQTSSMFHTLCDVFTMLFRVHQRQLARTGTAQGKQDESKGRRNSDTVTRNIMFVLIEQVYGHCQCQSLCKEVESRLARRRGGLMIRFAVLRQVTHETKGP